MHGAWGQFLKVAAAHLLAVVSPGPDFALVVRQSLSHGRRVALWSAVGIGTAILVHVTYAVLGIGILLRTYPLAFTVVKVAGAAYLAWIGVRALAAKPRVEEGPSRWGDTSGVRASAPAARAAWATGFTTNVLNPKATLFFVALFAGLVAPSTPRLVLGAYGIWMSLSTMAWFAFVSVVFTQAHVRDTFLRAGVWIDRVMGVVFIALAAFLALAGLGQA